MHSNGVGERLEYETKYETENCQAFLIQSHTKILRYLGLGDFQLMTPKTEMEDGDPTLDTYNLYY